MDIKINKKYEIVYANKIFEHVYDDILAFKNIYKILKQTDYYYLLEILKTFQKLRKQKIYTVGTLKMIIKV